MDAVDIFRYLVIRTLSRNGLSPSYPNLPHLNDAQSKNDKGFMVERY